MRFWGTQNPSPGPSGLPQATAKHVTASWFGCFREVLETSGCCSSARGGEEGSPGPPLPFLGPGKEEKNEAAPSAPPQ